MSPVKVHVQAKKPASAPTPVTPQTLYEQLRAIDDETASPSYRAMLLSVEKLLEKQREPSPDAGELQKLMRDCERAARNYLTTHRKSPFTSKGKKRVKAADALLSLSRSAIKGYTEKVEQENRKKVDTIIKAASKNGPSKFSLNRHLEISKLQRVITPVHTLSKVPQAVNTVSYFKRSGIGHKIANVTNAVMVNTVGLLGAAVTEAVTHEHDHGNSVELDTNLVPGGKQGEHYHDERDTDELFTDRRKIPLVWAKEIPEDPNGDIELSICVDQAKDGTDLGVSRSKGFQDKDAYGEKEQRFGHAFLTVKYSQVDPLTGARKRYQTSFGFYPHELFLGPAHGISQAQFGTTSPGRVSSDFGHDISAMQTFKITAEQFRNLITFTQNYEKGGYNALTRNCVNFTRDCAEHIGLTEALPLYQKTDLNSAEFVTIASPAAATLGLGYAAKLAAKNSLYRFQSMNSYSYQRFGQKMITKDDIKNLDMKTYQMRVKGYSPGLLGETIRAQENVPIHTKKWAGTKEMRKKAENNLSMMYQEYSEALKTLSPEAAKNAQQRFMDAHQKLFDRMCMAFQFDALRNKITSLPDFDPEDPVNKNALKKLTDFFNSASGAMATVSELIDINAEGKYNTTYKYQKVDYKEQKQAFRDLTKIVDSFAEGLNEIFRNTFRSDPRLNLEFGKVLSFAERIKTTAAKNYETLVSDNRIPFEDLSMLEGEFDPKREALRSLYDIKFSTKKYYANAPAKGKKPAEEYQYYLECSPLKAVAAIKVYGSLLEAVETTNDPGRLDKSLSEKEAASIQSERQDLVEDLANSMADRLGQNYQPTDEDIEMFFYALPLNEKIMAGNHKSNRDKDSPDGVDRTQSGALKGIVFEKYFSDVQKLSEAFIKKLREEENVSALTAPKKAGETLPDGSTLSPEKAKENLNQSARAETKLLSHLSNQILNFLVDKLRNPETAAAFQKMQEQTIRKNYEEQTGRTYDPKDAEVQKRLSDLQESAEYDLINDISERFILPNLKHTMNTILNAPNATAAERQLYRKFDPSGIARSIGNAFTFRKSQVALSQRAEIAIETLKQEDLKDDAFRDALLDLQVCAVFTARNDESVPIMVFDEMKNELVKKQLLASLPPKEAVRKLASEKVSSPLLLAEKLADKFVGQKSAEHTEKTKAPAAPSVGPKQSAKHS